MKPEDQPSYENLSTAVREANATARGDMMQQIQDSAL
jgi:hypothetical protein